MSGAWARWTPGRPARGRGPKPSRSAWRFAGAAAPRGRPGVGRRGRLVRFGARLARTSRLQRRAAGAACGALLPSRPVPCGGRPAGPCFRSGAVSSSAASCCQAVHFRVTLGHGAVDIFQPVAMAADLGHLLGHLELARPRASSQAAGTSWHIRPAACHARSARPTREEGTCLRMRRAPSLIGRAPHHAPDEKRDEARERKAQNDQQYRLGLRHVSSGGSALLANFGPTCKRTG